MINKKKVRFNYTKGNKPFRDVIWINLKTWEKELIRIPVAKTIRELPVTENHMSLELFNYLKEMESVETEDSRELID